MSSSLSVEQLKSGVIVRGAVFPEPVQIILAMPMGDAVKLIGKGMQSNQVYEQILKNEQLAQLIANPDREPFGTASQVLIGSIV